MAKISWKPYNQGQGVLFPVSIDSKIPEDHPVRLVNHIVDELDLSDIDFGYKGGGNSSYHPRMLLKILFYAYLNNVYSCRKIAAQLEQNIYYIWLSGDQQPNFRTINNFRSLRLKQSIHKLFVQIVFILVDMGYISLKELYVDGTKLESRANRYTFVWRKSVERNKAKLESKIRGILSQIEEDITQDNTPDDEPPTPINSQELKERLQQINRENRSKEELKQIKTLEDKHLPKLQEYEEKLDTLGERNSFGKTDTDSTFMRMKEDHMRNGQLKPAYNLQIGTENQFITHYALFPNPTDTLTLIPFMNGFESNYKIRPEKLCADSGYGSEENYTYLEKKEIEAYVKYNYFHKEEKRSFKNNAFLQENLYYNKQKDYFICPMGQQMKKIYTTSRKTQSGFVSEISVYKARRCQGCPLRCLCHKSENDRQIQVNHKLREYKRKVRERLTSEEGLRMRKRRPVEPEAVFGQIKYNKAYNRFRHQSQEKVAMDFAVFAIAFNLLKLHRKQKKAVFAQRRTVKNKNVELFRVYQHHEERKTQILNLTKLNQQKNAA